ncbi:alpha/beta-hydrolase [Lentithecium fluviatile CBS 122367]|uniref:Alpha/beta-hydrolase n=1 Tax=Lentithecium fluviatile CBS 122367 TaxID=1168545 RepID=A0A6G1IF54_9PLEO|nr:alpha/beta-hydrolase [Lentithecium fluviatile CBS 122367]
MSLITKQPFKTLWALSVVLLYAAKAPLLGLYYIIKRPNPKWTVRQALMNRIMRAYLYHSAVVRAKTTLKLEPGSEGERFIQIAPVKDAHLKGIMDDKTIRPVTTGGTWYPSTPPKEYRGRVILHLHGGGYAVGEGRAFDGAYAGQTLTGNTAPYALFVQYRLASNPGGRFPAALQDALSAYAHLLSQGYTGSNIIVSGDSAGAHIALCFIRYLSAEKVDLPPPRALLLWSPSINFEAAKDPSVTNGSKYYATDYLNGKFYSWGATKFTEGLDLTNNTLRAYVVQTGHAFRSVSPVWICVGGSEILGPEGLRMGEELREMGSVVETHTISHAPHDVLVVGNVLGFEKEAVEAAKLAGKFVEEQGGTVHPRM